MELKRIPQKLDKQVPHHAMPGLSYSTLLTPSKDFNLSHLSPELQRLTLQRCSLKLGSQAKEFAESYSCLLFYAKQVIQYQRSLTERRPSPESKVKRKIPKLSYINFTFLLVSLQPKLNSAEDFGDSLRHCSTMVPVLNWFIIEDWLGKRNKINISLSIFKTSHLILKKISHKK